jgi:hypothetical protein
MKDTTRIGGWDIHTYTIHDFGYNQMATSKTNIARATRYIDNKQNISSVWTSHRSFHR